MSLGPHATMWETLEAGRQRLGDWHVRQMEIVATHFQRDPMDDEELDLQEDKEPVRPLRQ